MLGEGVGEMSDELLLNRFTPWLITWWNNITNKKEMRFFNKESEAIQYYDNLNESARLYRKIEEKLKEIKQ